MAKQKVRYTRSGVFLRLRPYIWYAEREKMRHDAVDWTFCDAIIIDGGSIMAADGNQNSGPPIYLVSACLLGLPTRYDGTSKSSTLCQHELKEAVWIPVCPEQLGGLPTPRPPAELVGGQGWEVLHGGARVITRAGEDVTSQFISGARQVLKIAMAQRIDGAFLKSGSPSCGAGEVLGVTAALLENNGITVREF
jgi:uncharacterized protein YbbK (DUF523 family)